ncbi:UNVERIFIED_CONTAM: Polyadenylate-binding protein RBP45 [Sesamum radiatum]|uniref:Polyadenylate-binding protein RBP45 n=1 Tax=Sesamum radiatum TaxID=300843 RepID=A0AAW2K6J2_SESRA
MSAEACCKAEATLLLRTRRNGDRKERKREGREGGRPQQQLATAAAKLQLCSTRLPTFFLLVFVGGLDPNVTDDHLKQVFSQYGEVVHVKIPVGKRCGFVQFADRSCAEQALSNLNGTLLGGQNIRLSWGRNPSNKQSDQNQWGGAYYGYTQGYESYGGYAPPQDPNMYYGGYPGYANYQQPQQN